MSKASVICCALVLALFISGPAQAAVFGSSDENGTISALEVNREADFLTFTVSWRMKKNAGREFALLFADAGAEGSGGEYLNSPLRPSRVLEVGKGQLTLKAWDGKQYNAVPVQAQQFSLAEPDGKRTILKVEAALLGQVPGQIALSFAAYDKVSGDNLPGSSGGSWTGGSPAIGYFTYREKPAQIIAEQGWQYAAADPATDVQVVLFPEFQPLIWEGLGERRLQLTGAAGSAFYGSSLSVAVDISDFSGREIYERTFSTDMDKIGRFQQAFSVNFSQYGYYKYAVTVKRGQEELARKETGIAVLLPRSPSLPQDSIFGVCTHFGANWLQQRLKDVGPEPLLNLVKLAGADRIRDEVYWGAVEKEKGVYKFPAFSDAYIQGAHAKGLRPLIIFDYGNALHDHGKFPADTEDGLRGWQGYVRAMVNHYGGIVKHWEVWNEPNAYDTKTQYFPLLQAAYVAAKQVDPEAQIIGIGGAGVGGGMSTWYIDKVLDAGGWQYMDGFSQHPYVSPNSPDLGYGTELPTCSLHMALQRGKSVIDRITRAHPELEPLDSYLTEFGFTTCTTERGQDERTQAAVVMRTYLIAMRYPHLKGLYYYDFLCDGTDEGNLEHNFGLIRYDFSPKPSFLAYATAARLLKGRQFVKQIPTAEKQVQIYVFKDASGYTLAVWSTESEEYVLTRPSGENQRGGLLRNIDFKVGLQFSDDSQKQLLDWFGNGQPIKPNCLSLVAKPFPQFITGLTSPDVIVTEVEHLEEQ